MGRQNSFAIPTDGQRKNRVREECRTDLLNRISVFLPLAVHADSAMPLLVSRPVNAEPVNCEPRSVLNISDLP